MFNCAVILLPIAFLGLGMLTHFAFPPEGDDTTVRPEFIEGNENNTATSKPIILFDLHGVLFKPDYPKIFKLLLSNRQTLTLLAYLINPRVIRDVYRLWRKNVIAEEYINHLTATYPGLAPCKPFLFTIANTQKPIKPTVDVIRQLKKNGYTLHVLSNIGEHLFEELHHMFEGIFSYFDQIKVTTKADRYKGKPNLSIFYAYLRQCNPHQKKVVFVDNRRRNIKVGEELGFSGIHFTSARKLKKQLLEMHIILD